MTKRTIVTAGAAPAVFISAWIVFCGQALDGQIATASATTQSPYLNQAFLPAPSRAYVSALGTRLQIPGLERATLSGIFTEGSVTGAASLIRQVPGNIRFERPGSEPVLIYEAGNGLLNASSVSAPDANLLESLLDDAVEGFLYGYGNGYAYRLLGEHYRSDDGTTVNFTGPWYDVYQVAGSPRAQPAKTQRRKLYYFDSTTKLLAFTRYTESGVHVTTSFTGWSSTGGQTYPGQIVRTENGTTVFTFTITQGSTGPSAADGLFP